jgi:hypothetical protein
MKKALSLLAIVAGILVLSTPSAFAVLPTIDGTLGAGEWADAGYAFYRHETDPVDAGVRSGNDLVSATIFQQLSLVPTAGDGIYLAIETLTAVDFTDLNSSTSPNSQFLLDADFDGDGIPDFTIDVQDKDKGGPGGVTAEVIFNSFFPGGLLGDIEVAVGTVGETGQLGTNMVIELFVPSGAFNSPHIPFPDTTFIGLISSFDGGIGEDDEIRSYPSPAIPEPATMFLLGSGLLGMMGFRKKSAK